MLHSLAMQYLSLEIESGIMKKAFWRLEVNQMSYKAGIDGNVIIEELIKLFDELDIAKDPSEIERKVNYSMEKGKAVNANVLQEQDE